MNRLNFAGRLAAAPTQTGAGEKAIVKLTLIRNDYAGKDEGGEAKTRVVAIQFTAFGKKGEAIAKHCMKGDQLIVSARISNNNWTDKDEVEHYGFNFTIDEFEFGAPAAEKRAALDNQ